MAETAVRENICQLFFLSLGCNDHFDGKWNMLAIEWQDDLLISFSCYVWNTDLHEKSVISWWKNMLPVHIYFTSKSHLIRYQQKSDIHDTFSMIHFFYNLQEEICRYFWWSFSYSQRHQFGTQRYEMSSSASLIQPFIYSGRPKGAISRLRSTYLVKWFLSTHSFFFLLARSLACGVRPSFDWMLLMHSSRWMKGGSAATRPDQPTIHIA